MSSKSGPKGIQGSKGNVAPKNRTRKNAVEKMPIRKKKIDPEAKIETYKATRNKDDLEYINKHPELTAVLELMFENLCLKFDENKDVENGSLYPNQSPFSIAAKFLLQDDLKDLIQKRVAEKSIKG